MKKIRSLKFILILIFVMFLTPKDVFAENVTRAFTGTAEWYQQQGYYYGLPDVHNGMPGGYLIDYTESKSFPTNGSYYFLRPIDTNVNFIYGLKQLTLYSNVSVDANRVYTIQLIFASGSYIRYGYQFDTSLYNISNDSACYSSIGACSWSWSDNSMVITLAPTQSSTNYSIRIGNQANENKALALSTYTMGLQGMEIRSASIRHNNDVVDITPMVNQQIETNKKLDNINNNINNTNDKLDDLNNDINDSDTTESQNTISNFFNNFSTSDNGGLSSILTAPLRLLNKMLEFNIDIPGSCSSLTFPLPFVSTNVELPCVSIILRNNFNVVYQVLSLIINGLVIYYIIRNLFIKITEMKKPDGDKLEVYDL